MKMTSWFAGDKEELALLEIGLMVKYWVFIKSARGSWLGPRCSTSIARLFANFFNRPVQFQNEVEVRHPGTHWIRRYEPFAE
jgi:hypothetical protein